MPAVEAMTRVRSEVERGVEHTSETKSVFGGISKSTQSVTATTSKIAMLATEQLGFSRASIEQMKEVKQTRDKSRAELNQLETISSHLLKMFRQLEEATNRFIV
jgi:methyl-accepting chemotaxis protein